MADPQPARELRELFASAGWRVPFADERDHLRVSERGFDFVADAGTARYAVVVMSAREPRRALLEGQLASALLRARTAALAVDAAPLAIVCAPSVSDPLLSELGEFVARFGDGAAWGAMDDSGLVHVHGAGLQAVGRPRRAVRERAAVRRSDFLSDLGQWMLKALFSHRLPPALRLEAPSGAQIDEPLANAMALAKVAGVSVATASRFVAALKAEHFLAERAVRLEPMRVDALLDQWRAAYKRRPSESRARWLFPAKDPAKQLADAIASAHARGDRACVGLFAACDRLGLGLVHGVAPHLYVERASDDTLRRLGLRRADPGEAADVLIREPRYPESVFRGARDRSGARVADVLQCWLDVTDHPARGEEMAAHLHDHVIRPSLLERGR